MANINQKLREQLVVQLEQQSADSSQGNSPLEYPSQRELVEVKVAARPKPLSAFHSRSGPTSDPLSAYMSSVPLRDPPPTFDDMCGKEEDDDNDIVCAFASEPCHQRAKPAPRTGNAIPIKLHGEPQPNKVVQKPKFGRRALSGPPAHCSEHFIPEDCNIPQPEGNRGQSGLLQQAMPHPRGYLGHQDVSPSSCSSAWDNLSHLSRQPHSVQQPRPAPEPLPRRRAHSIDVDIAGDPEASPQASGYTPYTLEDYKKINQPVKLTALGYVETEDKIRGRELKLKMREYSQGVRCINQAPEPVHLKPILPPPNPEKDQALQMRLKAMEFAAKVPKPKAKMQPTAPKGRWEAEDEGLAGDALAALEWQHQRDQEEVQAIKRQLKL
eukprot:GGOE01004262.1.p1 GENE.GGOE01004262.1~~GGOE01004262.1.p1  ORF type:complete len:443 (-),score=24.92 GGOE01004262.1:406-1551(-)